MLTEGHRWRPRPMHSLAGPKPSVARGISLYHCICESAVSLLSHPVLQCRFAAPFQGLTLCGIAFVRGCSLDLDCRTSRGRSSEHWKMWIRSLQKFTPLMEESCPRGQSKHQFYSILRSKAERLPVANF